MHTDLGKELRKLRIDKEERLAGMASRLGVSASFISAVETGKKSPPAGFENLVARTYDLSAEQADRLAAAADASRAAFVIAPTSPAGRETAGLLARRINVLSDADMDSIRKILLNAKANK